MTNTTYVETLKVVLASETEIEEYQKRIRLNISPDAKRFKPSSS